MTASPGLGTWLRAQREQRLWTRTDLARRIIQAAKEHGDTTMPALAHLTHNLYRWERGANGISDRYRLYCADILGAPPAHPGTPARPAPANDTAGRDTPIVITITLPDGIDAQVKVTRPGDPLPDVPGTAGLMTASLRLPRREHTPPRPAAQSSHPVHSRARRASDIYSGSGEDREWPQHRTAPSRRARYPP